MLKLNQNIFFLFLGFFLLTVSCKTKEKASEINYLQNVEQLAEEAALKSAVSTIQVGDQLVIWITAKDMVVVKPFNQNYSSTEISPYSAPEGNTSQGQQQLAAPTYIVDSDGLIDFPVLGKLSVSGKTLVDIKDEIRDALSRYVISPSVSIRIINYKVTILGEVNKPGQYTIPDGQSTLLNALGLAGDLTMYGKRDNILLIRNENGTISKTRLNIMDDSFIYSPYYQLKQGDVLYVSANSTKDKISRLDPNTGTYIAVAGAIIGFAGIFITIFKN